MISPFDDKDLVELFRKQDMAGTRRLYDLYYRPLCYYTEKIVKNSQEAEDIVVETFLKLINKRGDFEKLSEIRSFLYTAARNASIDYLRKIKRQHQSHLELLYFSDPAFNDELEIINAQVLSVLYQEIENLPAQCAAVFKLLFFQRLSTSEIAAQMNISSKTVLNQKGKAIQLLRKSFADKGLLSLISVLALLR